VLINSDSINGVYSALQQRVAAAKKSAISKIEVAAVEAANNGMAAATISMAAKISVW